MALHTVNESKGHYGVSNGVSKKELESLVGNPSTSIIQYDKALTEKEIDLLEEVVFSVRPEIALRIYGHYSEKCDLSFIERLPSLTRISADCLRDATGINAVAKLRNLEELRIGIYNLESFDFLNEVNPGLKNLSLEQTKSKKPRIDLIQRFKNLEYLFLEGQQQGIEAINKLNKLKKIVLRSISTVDISYLEGLTELYSVNIKLGGIKNFDSLIELPIVKYLELWQVRGLSDISFISKMTTLQNLFLQSLRNVTTLPSFVNLKELRRMKIQNMTGLQDLYSLGNAPALAEFISIQANQNSNAFIPLLENPVLESISCHFTSRNDQKDFYHLVEKYEMKQFEYSEFRYK